MIKQIPIWLLLTVLLIVAASAEAQQPTKVPRIGFLVAVTPSTVTDRVEAFRQGLRELGYVEGKNIIIDFRYAEGKLDLLPALAAELVRLKVDVIVTLGPLITRSAKEATSTIPIVMGQDTDPVGNGFVASLARPGGNITGLSTLGPEISGKQLELLKETVPKLSRVAVMGTSTRTGNAQLRETERAAATFGVRLQYLDVPSSKDIEAAFRAASKGRAEALLVMGGPVLFSHRTQIADLAAKNRPGDIRKDRICGCWWPHVLRREHYGLISACRYLCRQDLERHEARRPTGRAANQFELVINLKTAKQIGLTIPPNVLARADRVSPMIPQSKIENQKSKIVRRFHRTCWRGRTG